MAEPFVGEIRMFAGDYPPYGWALCNGQELNISGNDVLFSLLGTMYGGNGQTTFALPNLMGRIPIDQGKNHESGTTFLLGQSGGAENVTLTVSELPAHTHPAKAHTEAGDTTSPENAVWASTSIDPYGSDPANVTMSPQSNLPSGGSMPHDNMMRFVVVSYIIALEGIYPTQS
ncbi:phage tail protein [Paenibacillus sp. MBLB4367]|uniref:phage tail protein n=1 Tax=Paenibacillus sp. MBLB4367 TaxID=3384767 RepID=UPI003907E818